MTRDAKPSPPADQARRDAVVAQIDRSLFVEAGAGTGKTTLMIARLVRLIESGVPIDAIVAITFTEKAAAELKVRLRRRLEQRAAEVGVGAGDACQPIRAALAGLESAAIDTIHGFCARLLRERPVEAGVDPGFAVADETLQPLLLDEAFDAFRDLCLAMSEAESEPLRAAFEEGMTLADVRAICAKLSDERDLVAEAGVLPEPGARPDGGAVEAAFRELVEQLAGARASCTDRDDRLYGHIGELEEQARRLDAMDAARRGRFLRCELKLNKGAGSQANWSPKSVCAEAKEAIKEFEARLAEHRAVFRAWLGARLLKFLAAFPATYEGVKRRHGVLDFQDLLVRARDVLKDDLEMREAFKARFQAILLDEFQDTDPLQAEIAFFLAEEREPERPATTWEEVRVGAGRLFLVGDPKQSIYRFRRADIALYEAAKDRLVACGGAVERIDVNFRSERDVLDWVNRFFPTCMTRSEHQAEYVALHARPGAPDVGPPAVAVLGAKETAPRAKVAETRRAEADAVAAYLRSLHESADVAYRDCAILFRSKAALGEYEDRLRAFGVPYQVARGKHLFSRAEVKAAVSLLRAVDDPSDGIAVVAVLRSVLFGVSDADLARHKIQGGSFDYLMPCPAESPRGVRDALESLRAWHDDRHRFGLGEFVNELWARSRALEMFALKPSGEQRVANLKKFVEMARALEQAGERTFRSFVARVSALEQDEEQETDSPLVDDERDAVQLLTIHVAKGLEFEVVCVADLCGDAAGGSDWFLVERRPKPRIEFAKGNVCTAGFDAAADVEKAKTEAEELRLLYVAATRAKRLLVLPRFPRLTKNGEMQGRARVLQGDALYGAFRPEHAARWIDPATLSAAAEEEGAFRCDVEPGGALGEAARDELEARETFGRELRALFADPRHARAVTSATARAAERKQETLAFGGGGAAAGERGDGRAFGILVHRVFEQFDLAGDGSDAEAIAGAAALECGATPARAAEAAALARRFLHTDLCERLRRARRVLREVPFAARDAGGTIVEGAIDVLAEEADGRLLVVDWKSDAVKPGEVDARFEVFREQARIYAEAAAAATGREVADVAFAFLRAGVVRFA